MEFTLDCKTRPDGSKANALRREGLIPVSLYGHNGAESVALTVDAKTVETLLRSASVNNSLVQVNVPDLPWNGKAMLREVQKHPWKGYLYHISLFSVGSQVSLEADVPVHVVGEAPGVKTGGGALDVILSQLHVRCAPERIPEFIEVDISNLEAGQSLHVNELVLPEGVVVQSDANQVVVTILAGAGATAADEE